MNKPHLDFLLSISDSYVKRHMAGEKLTYEELLDAITVNNKINELHNEITENTSKRLDEIEKTIPLLRKQNKRDIDETMAFLKCYGLEDQFEVFIMRLHRKLYKGQKKNNHN